MTLQEIKESTKDVLTPEDIAEVLEQDPQCLRINLREHPDWFEFPKYRKSEKRFVFPRLAFLKWMGVSVDD